MAMSQALALTADLKLGWYTSIPPREMFACQIIGTILGCFANCDSAASEQAGAALMGRHDSRQCHWREEAVLGRLGGGPYGAVDWTSARYLLFCQYHLGCGRA